MSDEERDKRLEEWLFWIDQDGNEQSASDLRSLLADYRAVQRTAPVSGDEELRRLAEELYGEPALGIYAGPRRVAEEARQQERDKRLEEWLGCCGDLHDPEICVCEDIRSLLADYRALRAERDRLREDCEAYHEEARDAVRCEAEAYAKCQELKADRDRLREALKQIVAIGTGLIEHDPPLNHEIVTACGEMDRVARRALASEGKKP